MPVARKHRSFAMLLRGTRAAVAAVAMVRAGLVGAVVVVAVLAVSCNPTDQPNASDQRGNEQHRTPNDERRIDPPPAPHDERGNDPPPTQSDRRENDPPPESEVRALADEFEDTPETLAVLARIQDEVSLIGRVTPGHVRTLQALYRQWPNSDRVVGAYDRALRSRSDWDALIDLHEPRMITHPSRNMNRYMAVLLIEAKRFKQAMTLLQSLRAAEPNDPEAAWLLAKAAFGMGDVELAGATLDSCWTRLMATGNADAMFLRGLICFHQDRFDDARRRLQDVLDINPNHVSANNTLGRVLVALGKPDEAAPFLARARRLQHGINARERAELERVSRWQGVEDACGAADPRACESHIRAALQNADASLTKALYTKLVAFYRDTHQPDKAQEASTALQSLQRKEP
ncbi:MAG: tetratricopeptide repeat protein [Phycisphaerae bacterium]